ncbi:MAG: hypothetical protein RIR39_1972 [Pseudomonadota bacterium]|jgi:hypothetical protein
MPQLFIGNVTRQSRIIQFRHEGGSVQQLEIGKGQQVVIDESKENLDRIIIEHNLVPATQWEGIGNPCAFVYEIGKAISENTLRGVIEQNDQEVEKDTLEMIEGTAHAVNVTLKETARKNGQGSKVGKTAVSIVEKSDSDSSDLIKTTLEIE